MRVWVTMVALAMAAFAGCAEDAAPAEDDAFSPELDEQLKATEDTGIIRGVVVDPAVVPLAAVVVTIQSLGRETQTNQDGLFGFDQLEPGTYFLQASKPGFLPIQSSVEVQAGVDQPPIVRILMERDVLFNPYYNQYYHQGYYECGTSVVVVCAAPNILLGEGTTGDASTPTIKFEADPTFIQAEMVWESSQAISTQLYFEMESLDDDCNEDRATFIDSARGDSPIKAWGNETELEESAIGGPDCGIYFSVFSGDALAGAHCQPDLPCIGPGFSIQQDFEWFITEFHGYEPSEEWWFINDGPLPPPQ